MPTHTPRASSEMISPVTTRSSRFRSGALQWRRLRESGPIHISRGHVQVAGRILVASPASL